MSVAEKIILKNLFMIINKNGQILVQNRQKGGWDGIALPDEHIEASESFVQSIIRGVFEEAGFKIEKPQLCNIKKFYTQNNERYVVLLFKAIQFIGEINPLKEREVFWIYPEDLSNYTSPIGFEELLTVFTSDITKQNHYLIGDE